MGEHSPPSEDMGGGPAGDDACFISRPHSCHGGESQVDCGGVRRWRRPTRPSECKGRTIPSDTSSTMWPSALATVSMVVIVVAVLIEPCHSKVLQHHSGHLFNFERATGAAAYPKRPDDIDHMADLVDLANDIGNDYKMLVHDLKHNKNEFADSPHNADDLLALLEAMHHFPSDYAPIPKKQRLVRLT